MKQPANMKQAIDKVIEKMTGVMTRKEIVDAVLKKYRSTAKNPASSIMNDLRYRKEIVALGNARYARADYILDGAKFRIVLSESEISLGIIQRLWFNPFDQVLPPIESVFVDSDGEVIPIVTKTIDADNLTNEELKSLILTLGESALKDPALALSIPVPDFFADDDDVDEEDEFFEEFDEEDELFEEDEFDEEDELLDEIDEEAILDQARKILKGKLKQEIKMHDYSGFCRKHQAREGDSLIVTMKPKENTYVFEHEPVSQIKKSLIEQRDLEMSKFINQVIKRKERQDAREIIFQAYGNFVWLKEYPPSHWLELVEKDDGLRLINIIGDNFEIASIDYKMMLDSFGVDDVTERKLMKRRTSIEQEIDDFLNRLDQAYESATEDLTGKFDWGGAPNVISRARKPQDEDKIYKHNEKLIDQFFDVEKKKSRDEGAAGRKAGEIAMLAEYLCNYEEQTLEYATVDDLDEFLFDWYPRKVINSSASHAKQIAASIRDFYRFLVMKKIIRSAKFAEAIYELRDLAGEKIDLYARLPMGDDGELAGQLFGW